MEFQADVALAPDIKPDILREENWEDWSQEFPLYLSHIMGKQRVSLEYVICPPISPGHIFATPREAKLYSYPHLGLFYCEDNKEVFRLLSNRVKEQPATWIQGYQATQNGRAAWLALVDHYDGGGQQEKQINVAENIINSLFYNNERVFAFDAYAAKLVRAFRTLENTPNRRTPANQVRILLENIRITTADFAVIKGHVCTNFRSDFQGAIEYISRMVSELFPNVYDANRRGTGRYWFISEANTSAQRPCNFEGLEHNNGVYTFFGVDVTNVHRMFTPAEFNMLGSKGQAYVFNERARLRSPLGGRSSSSRTGGRGRGQDRGGRCTHIRRSISAVANDSNTGASEMSQTHAAAASTPNPRTPSNNESSDRGSLHGQRFGLGAHSTSSVRNRNNP
ncbi:hypothetical protein ACA910_019642 [Epithemia clementina (nom. ined.)]